ncbi:MAG: hypothetical protein MZV63_02195 [Marinilabiliales bacterium]|nr:hypothetical protein [Marinilabiliales bacterium]
MTSGLIKSFSKQLHADFEILSIHPDTLFFGYDKLVTRSMAVMPDLDVELAAGNKVIIVPDPDSITVTGPAHILDTLERYSHTASSVTSRMDENFKVEVPLEYP